MHSMLLREWKFSVRSIFHLKEHIENEASSIDEQNRPIVICYVGDMEDLLQYLRSLSEEW